VDSARNVLLRLKQEIAHTQTGSCGIHEMRNGNFGPQGCAMAILGYTTDAKTGDRTKPSIPLLGLREKCCLDYTHKFLRPRKHPTTKGRSRAKLWISPIVVLDDQFPLPKKEEKRTATTLGPVQTDGVFRDHHED